MEARMGDREELSIGIQTAIGPSVTVVRQTIDELATAASKEIAGIVKGMSWGVNVAVSGLDVGDAASNGDREDVIVQSGGFVGSLFGGWFGDVVAGAVAGAAVGSTTGPGVAIAYRILMESGDTTGAKRFLSHPKE
jgi:hypothetical protein